MEKLEFKSVKEQTLFDAILNKKPTLNYSVLKTALRKKDIKVNGKRIKENVILKQNDFVEMYLSEKKRKNIKTLFEDENVLIVFKPAGIEVTTKDKTYLESESLEELTNAKACHRLDKNTEGIVVLAKNEMAKKCLFSAFKNHKIKKEYQAIVFGNINKNGETFEDFLKKEQNFVKICKKNDKNAKIAKLSYTYIFSKDDLNLIKINLETGRTHQIRVQLSHHGIFVLGDEKYGDKDINKKYHKSKQQLCAYKITFENLPVTLNYLSGKSFEVKPTYIYNFFNMSEK